MKFKTGDKVKLNALYFEETDYGDKTGPKKDEILTLLKINEGSFQNCVVSFITTDTHYIFGNEGPRWYINSTHLDLVKTINLNDTKSDPVKSPSHYNHGKIQPIDFIRDQDLNYNCGAVVKYVCRAGRKDPSKHKEDLEKAMAYLQHEINSIGDK